MSATEDEELRPKKGGGPEDEADAPPARPEGMVEDTPPGFEEDETDAAVELGEIADEGNPELARAKERLRKIVENGRL